MAIDVPPFVPSVVITENDQISETDDKIITIMSEVETYLETETQNAVTQMETEVQNIDPTVFTARDEAVAAATNAELEAWEAEAQKMTADSYATEPEDTFVKIYTSNGDGTFTATDTTEYSSLHWAAKSESAATGDIIDDNITSTTSTWSSQKINEETSNPDIQTATFLGGTGTQGQTSWSADDDTLSVVCNDDVSVQVGQELLVRVKNTSGATITNGTVLMVTGAVGNSGLVTVSPHDGTQSNGYKIAGIATQDLLNNDIGFSTLRGKIRGIDTTGTPYGETWAEGDGIWVKPNDDGALTNIEPLDDELDMFVGIVVNVHANTGSIQARTNGIDENRLKPWVTSNFAKLDDNLISTDSTWSSDKINSELSNVSSIDDNVTALDSTWSSIKIQEEIGNSGSVQIQTPTITSPTDGTIDFLGNIESSPYAPTSNFNGTLDYVRWQLATDINFTNIVDDKSDSLSLAYSPTTDPLTTYYVRVRYGSDNHLSNWSTPISFTSPDAIINTPTITSPTEGQTDLGKNVEIVASAYSVFNHSEPHLSSDWEIATDIGFTNIVDSSIDDTVNLTTYTSGDLTENTTYYARVRYKSASYTSSYSNAVSFTTKELFAIYSLGQPGELGFGVATAEESWYQAIGATPLTGHDVISDSNYGNYLHVASGAILVCIPKHYFKIDGNTFSYSDVPQTGYVIDRSFLNGDGAGGSVECDCVFVAKYGLTKNGTIASAQQGQDPMSSNSAHNPISALTGSPSNTLGGLYQAVKTLDSNSFLTPIFHYQMLARMAKAHGESSLTTSVCAYIDVDPKFPKGNLNDALSDVNDTSVTFTSSGYSNCAMTGSGVPFAKTTHNGQACGVADLNGNMWEVASGFIRTNANGFLILKDTVDIRTITDDTTGATGSYNPSLYDAIDISATVTTQNAWTYLGNGANPVFGFSTDKASSIYKQTAIGIPLASGVSAAGTTEFGNDGLYRASVNEMACLVGGDWSYSSNTGAFCMSLGSNRTTSINTLGGRASFLVQ